MASHLLLPAIAGVGLTLVFLLLTSHPAAALNPSSVAVIANPEVAGSYEVAAHYVQARGIPQANLLNVSAPTTETINRTQYQALEAAVAAALEGAGLADSVEVLVLVYGVPLKVDSPETFDYYGTQASVDSELALLYSSSESGNSGRQSNPYYDSFAPFNRSAFDDMLLVARLDGPTVADAKALVDSALAAEADGTLGWAYFDRDTGMGGDYRGYDEMIVEAFNLSLVRGLAAALEVTAKDIGQSGAEWSNRSTPGAEPANGTVSPFFYWGWYANSSYYDSFNWTTGALGQRIHSFNARSMRDSSWVPGAVADGIGGTSGHVWEPWLDAAARPQTVMEALYDGYTLAEAYWMGSPFLSWQNIVVGDPLYTPVELNFSLTAWEPSPPEPLLPGDNLTLNFTLTNDGPLNQPFQVSLEGLPGGFSAELTPAYVWVNGSGGQAAINLTVYLRLDPREAPAGDYNLSLAAIPAGGTALSSTAKTTLTVAQVAGAGLEPLQNGKAAPGDSTFPAIKLTNLGNGPDIFTLSVAPPQALAEGSLVWLSPGRNWTQEGVDYLEVPLEFGESAYVQFNFTLPFDMGLLAGSLWNLTVTTRSGFETAVNATVNLTLEVAPYYGLEVDPPPDQSQFVAGRPMLVNFTFYNTGNVPYTLHLTAYAGGEESWLRGAASAQASLAPQQNRTVELNLEVRPEATAGLQSLAWDLTWPGPAAAGEVEVEVLRPDLWLEEAKLLNLEGLRDPREGDSLTLKAWVRSNGVPFEGNFTLRVTGYERAPVLMEIGPGALPYRLTLNGSLPVGAARISLSLEPPEGLYELDRANNLAWVNVTVKPQPDLRIVAFEVEPGPPGSGQATVNFTVTTVPIDGPGASAVEDYTLSPRGVVALSLDGQLLQSFWLDEPVKEFSLQLNEVEGAHELNLSLDPDNRWPETDEENNEASLAFEVKPGSPEGSGLAGLAPLLGGVLVGGGAAGSYLVWRRWRGG